MDNSSSSQDQANPRLLQDSSFPSGIIKPRMLAADPSMSIGDTYFVNSDGIFQRLPAGADGAITVIAGGIPSYVAPGSTGQVLEIVAGIPTWTTPSSAQTINLSRSSTGADFTSSSTSYVDVTNYSVVGVVLAVSSDVEVEVMISYQKNTTTGNGQNVYQLLYGSTVIGFDIYKTTTGNGLNESLFIRETVKNLAAGTYTFKLQAKNNAAGTITVGPGEITVMTKPTS